MNTAADLPREIADKPKVECLLEDLDLRKKPPVPSVKIRERRAEKRA